MFVFNIMAWLIDHPGVKQIPVMSTADIYHNIKWSVLLNVIDENSSEEVCEVCVQIETLSINVQLTELSCGTCNLV